jgi:hypothetical protein
VFVRSLELTDNMRCRGLLVLAESAEARDLCLHLVPELEASPTDELHIVLLMRDIRRTWTAKTPPCCLRAVGELRFRPIPLLEEQVYAMSSLRPVVDLDSAVARAPPALLPPDHFDPLHHGGEVPEIPSSTPHIRVAQKVTSGCRNPEGREPQRPITMR